MLSFFVKESGKMRYNNFKDLVNDFDISFNIIFSEALPPSSATMFSSISVFDI